MLKLFSINYTEISEKILDESFILRKITFKDRLNWDVICSNGMERDVYDNKKTNYIFGMVNNTIVCSVRLIEMRYPNMIDGTFFKYFNNIILSPDGYIESSRFFVDKERTKCIMGNHHSLSLSLFLSMINYAMTYQYKGIYTIVSQAMYILLKRSGWNISLISEGVINKNQTIFLLLLNTDTDSQQKLIDKITKSHNLKMDQLRSWPMLLPIDLIKSV